MIRFTSLSLLLALFALPLAAEEPGRPIFLVRTLAGKVHEGPLQELGKDWRVQLIGQPEALPGAQLLALRRVGRPLLPFPQTPHVILGNGDRIPITSPRLDGEKLLFRHLDLGGEREVALPLGTLSVLWWRAPEQGEEGEKLRQQLVRGSRKQDTLLLTNGDVVEGVLVALDENKVEMQASGKSVTLDLRRVSALALSTTLVETLRPRGSYARVVLADPQGQHSTRLTLSAATSDSRTLEGTTAFGATLAVPVNRLLALEVHQHGADLLSELEPRRAEFSPYLDLQWLWKRDSSVTGHDLRLGESTFDRGLALPAHTKLTFALEGRYRRFTALAGLDPRTGRLGSARVRLWGDGKPLPLEQEGELRSPREVLTIDVPVTGVRELTLEVEFGRRGGVQAQVNWVETWLVK